MAMTALQFQCNNNNKSTATVVKGSQQRRNNTIPRTCWSSVSLLLLFVASSCFISTPYVSAKPGNVRAVNVSLAHLFEPSDSILFAPLPPSSFPKPTHWIDENPEFDGLDDVTVIAKPKFGKHRPDQDAVLAYAEGYDLPYYMMFLETLASTGYTGDVVLAIAESWYVKENVEDYLLAFHERYQGDNDGPNLIIYQHPLECENKDAENGKKRAFVRSGDTDVFQFCSLNHFYGWKDEDGNVKKEADDGRQPRVVATLRYEWYWVWSLQYNPHSWLMLIDARDTFFQTNPFHGLPRESSPSSTKPDGLLYFFGENPDATRLGKSKKNMKWLGIGYGKKTLDALADKPTICSGSTMGEQIALETYLRALINEHDEADVRMTGSDQGFHNYLYYSKKLSGADTIRRLVVWEQGKGIINNLGALRVKTLDEWGMYDTFKHQVYQWDGVTLSPVAHQWDRDKDLHSWMQSQFRRWKNIYKEKKGKTPLFSKIGPFQEDSK